MRINKVQGHGPQLEERRVPLWGRAQVTSLLHLWVLVTSERREEPVADR